MPELSPDELQLAFHEVECRTYDERFGIWPDAHGARAAAREARALIGDRPLGTVVDVGCGTGYLGLGLAATGVASDVHLVDLSPGMLDRARDNAAALDVGVRFVRATATALPYADASVDAVVTRGVLHHLDDVEAALREWRRVVRPGGLVLVLSEPTPVADRVGGVVARCTLAALRAARVLGRRLGRPLSAHPPDRQREHEYWDLVAMAANLHTFTAGDLRAAMTRAGLEQVEVRASGSVAIGWAVSYYVLVGELPGLAASATARRRAARVWVALRRVDDVVSRVVPARALLTVQAIGRR